MPLLDEPCMDDFECQMKVGDNAICREPIGMCKCREGYYFETHEGASKMECHKCKNFITRTLIGVDLNCFQEIS